MERTKEEILVDTAVHLTRVAKQTKLPKLREAYKREAQKAIDDAAELEIRIDGTRGSPTLLGS
jgi:hypothetical protein